MLFSRLICSLLEIVGFFVRISWFMNFDYPPQMEEFWHVCHKTEMALYIQNAINFLIRRLIRRIDLEA